MPTQNKLEGDPCKITRNEHHTLQPAPLLYRLGCRLVGLSTVCSRPKFPISLATLTENPPRSHDFVLSSRAVRSAVHPAVRTVHQVSCPRVLPLPSFSTLPRSVRRPCGPGKLLISLELLPKESADAQPVGSGRNEPNQNPYLPPPAGRMKLSFNPLRLSMSLLGPKAFYKVPYVCLRAT